FNYRNQNFGLGNPIQPDFLDAGPSISMTTPSDLGIGNRSLPFQDGNYVIDGLMPTGSFKRDYTFTRTGGADIVAFRAQGWWRGAGGGFNFATPGNNGGVNRGSGLTVTWNQPGSTDPDETIQIYGFAFVPNVPFGAEFVCNVPLSPGRFVIPPTVLL